MKDDIGASGRHLLLFVILRLPILTRGQLFNLSRIGGYYEEHRFETHVSRKSGTQFIKRGQGKKQRRTKAEQVKQ